MPARDQRHRRLLTTLAVLIAPTAGVLLARLGGASEPASAGAAAAVTTPDAPGGLPAGGAIARHSAERIGLMLGALKAADARRAAASDDRRSPMSHPQPPADATVEVVDHTPAEPEIEPSEPTPSFTLNAVLRGDGVAVASINGQIHQLGGTVAGGWTLVAIDGKSRSVTLRSAKGATLTLTAPIR